MSRLPNAPLLEVIFELRWVLNSVDDFSKFEYLHGDLYNQLKSSYPERQPLVPPGTPPQLLINSPIYRFRKETNGYPLVQVGPGLVTLNTIDAKYDWKTYYEWCRELTTTLISLAPISTNQSFSPNLIYLDFYKLDFAKEDAIEFINDNLNITFNQSFFTPKSPPTQIAYGFSHSLELGQLDIMLNSGKNSKNEDGIIVKTQISGGPKESSADEILDWLSKAHEFCSVTFEEMTKGKLFNSFK